MAGHGVTDGRTRQTGSSVAFKAEPSLRYLLPVGAGNSAVVVDLPRCGPMLSPRVPNLVPIPGPWMQRETPGQRPRPNYGHPQDRPAGADGGIRTPTPVRVLGPKPSASARFRHVREPTQASPRGRVIRFAGWGCAAGRPGRRSVGGGVLAVDGACGVRFGRVGVASCRRG